jgi:hypothetical protein
MFLQCEIKRPVSFLAYYKPDRSDLKFLFMIFFWNGDIIYKAWRQSINEF